MEGISLAELPKQFVQRVERRRRKELQSNCSSVPLIRNIWASVDFFFLQTSEDFRSKLEERVLQHFHEHKNKLSRKHVLATTKEISRKLWNFSNSVCVGVGKSEVG